MKIPTEHYLAGKPIVILAPSALKDHRVGRRFEKYIFAFLSTNGTKQPN
jgi:hypothetical protein